MGAREARDGEEREARPHAAAAQLLLSRESVRARAGDEPVVAPPESQKAPEASVRSDSLPLAVVGLLALCFLVYFGGALRSPSALAGRDGLRAERPAARAYELEICNRAAVAPGTHVYVAVAYFDFVLRDWVARGWFPQEQGCRLALRNLTSDVFVYAESRDGGRRWGDDDGEEFCIDSHGPFVLPQRACAGTPPAAAARRWQRFKRLAPDGGSARLTWEIDG